MRAQPDGYSLLFVLSANVINTALYDHLNFNFIRDTAPVACVGGLPFVMLVNPSFAAKTVPEFIAYAKANPGKINMASQGNAGAAHVYGELFSEMAGMDLFHVPYRGNALPDLRRSKCFFSLPSTISLIRVGKLRALAVTTASRMKLLPDVPTVAEFVPGMRQSGGKGSARLKTPTPGSSKSSTRRSMHILLIQNQSQLCRHGLVPMPMMPAAFGKFIADGTEKWAKVIRDRIKAE